MNPKLLKIEGIKELDKYGLPHSETMFVFDFKKQEQEIDEFLKGKKYVTIRSDKINSLDFCPHDLRCPKAKVKPFVKNLNAKSYAAILQSYVPIYRDRRSGNILNLKKHIFVELMGEGPLTWLNRDGQVEEQIKFKKDNFKEVEHFGKRLLTRKEILPLLKLVKGVPPYKLMEFTLRPEGIYFWQMRNDKTSKSMEG